MIPTQGTPFLHIQQDKLPFTEPGFETTGVHILGSSSLLLVLESFSCTADMTICSHPSATTRWIQPLKCHSSSGTRLSWENTNGAPLGNTISDIHDPRMQDIGGQRSANFHAGPPRSWTRTEWVAHPTPAILMYMHVFLKIRASNTHLLDVVDYTEGPR